MTESADVTHDTEGTDRRTPEQRAAAGQIKENLKNLNTLEQLILEQRRASR